jgi:hypothetical protein
MGSKKQSSPPPAPTAEQIAQQNLQAQLSSIPQAAQLQYNVLTNPQYGLEATSREYERVRQGIFPDENAVREQLTQNILQQLISPTGLTPEQQSAISARRGQAQDEYTRALRTRANLGGGLFGGRSQLAEQRGIQDLQNQFVEEDVNREERNRLNNSQLALQVLNVLFPGSGIQTPQFINPVPSADTSFNAALTGRGQDIGIQQANINRSAALQSALFGALGTAAGGAFGSSIPQKASSVTRLQ